MLLSLLLFTLLLLPVGVAQQGNKEMFFENESIAIHIIGNENVPMYQFWQPGENNSDSDKYQVKFIRLFEVIDENDDATYNQGNESIVPGSNNALASFSWDFSEKLEEETMVHFNMTSVGESFTIQFRNHFDLNESSLKFDIVIEDYDFVSQSEDVMLVLTFHLISPEKNMNQEQNRLSFGNNGYFESETEAEAGNATIQAGLSNGEDGSNKAAFISFERFTGRMVHDPTIGLESSSSSIPGYSNFLYPLGIALIGILFLTRKKINSN